MRKGQRKDILIFLFLLSFSFFSCASQAIRIEAEEAYTLGQAYQNLKKYEDAERWYNIALRVEKTENAALYQLGRIAWERKDYTKALSLFADLLKKDPENTMALRSAAYAALRLEDFPLAESYYSRLLALIPFTAKERFNYALVLYSLDKFSEAQSELELYFAEEAKSGNALLLLARIEKEEGSPHALDSYAEYLEENASQILIRYEYAQLLIKYEHYALALAAYEKIIPSDQLERNNLKKADILFEKAELLLLAGEDGVADALAAAEKAGFSDSERIEKIKNELNKKGASDDAPAPEA